MRKRTASRLIVTLAVTLVAAGLTMLSMPATRALAEDYRYTIRVFPGNRGRLPEEPVSVKVSKGEDIDLYQIASVEVTDPKYVHTGFRLSGQDKLYGNGRVNGISEDMDFVVSYGVEADAVPYTLRFVEYGTGKELIEAKTYYGRDGEKPVAAFEHISGYRPRYLAITGTLHKGEENVWTFEYVPLGEGETIVTNTTTNGSTYTIASEPQQPETETQRPADANGNGNANAPEGTDDAGAGMDATGNGGNAGTERAGDASQDTAGNGTQGSATEPETQEILDLDTPLAGPNGTNRTPGSDATLLGQPVIVAIACVGALIAAGLWFLIMRRRKAKQDEEA